MNLFHKMIVNTISKQMGDGAQAFANEVCGELGVPFDSLQPEHMKQFSEIVYKKAEPRIGEIKAKSLAGIISHFEKSRL